MAGSPEWLIACDAWLEANPDHPRYWKHVRWLREYLFALWKPQDTLRDRRYLLDVAELNGYPAYPSLSIAGSAAGWRFFLASDCGLEALLECRRAWWWSAREATCIPRSPSNCP